MKNGNGKKVESYIAHASVKAGASARAILSAYKIEVRFLGGLTTAQKNAFKGAADRWSNSIRAVRTNNELERADDEPRLSRRSLTKQEEEKRSCSNTR